MFNQKKYLKDYYKHHKKQRLVYLKKNKELIKKQKKEWRLRNIVSVNKIEHDYRLKNIEKIKKNTKVYYSINKEKIIMKSKDYNRIARLKCLKYYSNGIPKCNCCGETIYEFLAIDHINNDGAKHRKEINNGKSGAIYNWIIKNKFPPIFQVLCHNCNMAKGFYGECPHKKLSTT